MASGGGVIPDQNTAPSNATPPIRRSYLLKVSILVNVVLAVAIIVILTLAIVPTVQVEKPGVAWFGISAGSCPSGCVAFVPPSEFCPPQSYDSVTGNVTLSLMWATESGHQVQKFWVWSDDYLTSPGTYVYTVYNSSAGNFSYESPTLAVSLCRYDLNFGAISAAPETVAVTVVTTYTYTATAPML